MLDTVDLMTKASAYKEPLLDFLRDLIRIPSVNGRDSEAQVAERIRAEAEQLGFNASLPAADPDRPNVLVSWGKGPVAFAVIAHIDTVSEGKPDQWTHPPFSAVISDGRLYGRGTADNKAGIACGLYTMALLRDHGYLNPAKTRLLLAGVVDEESGASSELGVRYLLDQGLLTADGAIYAYASDIVCVGHRGLMRLQLEARGRSIHPGSPEWSRGEGGVNAVTGLADILLRLETLDLPVPEHPAFTELGFTITPGTLFNGGICESMVPPVASALVDIRLMPGQPSEQVLDAVNAVIDSVTAKRPGLKVDLEVLINLPGVTIPSSHPLAITAQRYAEAITGVHWPIAGAGPANEGYMLIEAGIPTLPGFGPTGGNAHAPDEWVDCDSLSRTVATFSGLICDYLSEIKAKKLGSNVTPG